MPITRYPTFLRAQQSARLATEGGQVDEGGNGALLTLVWVA